MREQFNPFVSQRREMKLRFLDLIKTHPNIEKKQLIGLFSLQTGLRKARLLEYWDELVEAGMIDDGGWNSAKRSVEGNSEGIKCLDDGHNRTLADCEGNTEHQADAKDGDSGREDNESEPDASKTDT